MVHSYVRRQNYWELDQLETRICQIYTYTVVLPRNGPLKVSGQISLFSLSLFLFSFFPILFYVNLSRVRPVHGPWAFVCLLPAHHTCARVLPDLLAAANRSLVHWFILLWVYMDGFGDN